MVIAYVAALAFATDLPVSADLENGFGDTPETVAETIRLGAAAGLVGGSIEDATGQPADPIFEQQLAADRIRATAQAARDLPFPFTLTACAENYLHGRTNLKDTIQRLQVYQEAGADVLYAPGLTQPEDIAAVLSSIDRPLNVLAGLTASSFTLAQLSDLGVRRISSGAALARTAYGAALNTAREMLTHGPFDFAVRAVPFSELNTIFRP